MNRNNKTPLFESLFKLNKEETLIEELVSAAIHGIGAVLSIIALIILVILSSIKGNWWQIVSATIYGLTLILAYSASTMYHLSREQKAKKIFKILDFTSIYFLIAGTYTPITLINLHGWLGWSLFEAIWITAFLGIIFKAIFFDKYEILSTLIYLLMGWLAIVAIKPIYHALTPAGFMWILAGGLFYTIGIIFFLWKRLRFSHGVWHVFVLGGSICHFFAIIYYVILPINTFNSS